MCKPRCLRPFSAHLVYSLKTTLACFWGLPTSPGLLFFSSLEKHITFTGPIYLMHINQAYSRLADSCMILPVPKVFCKRKQHGCARTLNLHVCPLSPHKGVPLRAVHTSWLESERNLQDPYKYFFQGSTGPFPCLVLLIGFENISQQHRVSRR